MPILAIGGAESSGEGAANTMKLVADNVQGVVLPDAGHWVAEQAPEALLAALTAFLSPYRDAAFWAEITGWVRTPGSTTLRHPAGVGPLLELCAEPEPRRGKNRLHLDVRPGPGDEDVARAAQAVLQAEGFDFGFLAPGERWPEYLAGLERARLHSDFWR